MSRSPPEPRPIHQTGNREGTLPVPRALSLGVKLLELLQGRWLGHPLHPAIVHIPVGLWVVAPIADVLAGCDVAPALLSRLAAYAAAGGVLGALVAIPTGAAEWASIKPEKPAWRLTLAHMLVNLLATVIWAVNCGLRLAVWSSEVPLNTLILATSLLGLALVLLGGWLGGLLTYDRGTAVGRDSKKEWRALAVRGGSRVPEEK